MKERVNSKYNIDVFAMSMSKSGASAEVMTMLKHISKICKVIPFKLLENLNICG